MEYNNLLEDVEWDGALSFSEECVTTTIEDGAFGFRKFANEEYKCWFVFKPKTNSMFPSSIKRKRSDDTEVIELNEPKKMKSEPKSDITGNENNLVHEIHGLKRKNPVKNCGKSSKIIKK